MALWVISSRIRSQNKCCQESYPGRTKTFIIILAYSLDVFSFDNLILYKRLIDADLRTGYNHHMEFPSVLNIRFRNLLLGLFAFLFLYSAWLLRGQDLFWERFWIGNLTLIFSSCLIVYLAWNAQQTAAASSRRAWSWIVAGLLIWFLLICLRLLPAYTMTNNLLSIALRLLHLIGGLIVWIGLAQFSRSLRNSLSPKGLVFDAVLTSLALLFLLWKAWVQPLAGSYFSPQSTILIPIVVDLITLVVILNLFLLSQVEKASSALAWVFLAMLAFSFSDMSYIAQVLALQPYSAGTVLDLGWVVGNLCLLTAVTIYSQSLPINRPAFFNRVLQRSQSLLPIISVILLGWYALINWQLHGVFDPLSLWGTAILGLGLLVRQGFQAGENAMEQYARLVNSIAEPAFVCDDHGKLRLVNIAFLQIAATPPTSVLSKQLNTFFDFSKEDVDWLAELLKLSKTNKEISSSREVGLRGAHNEMIPVLLTLRSVESGYQQNLAYAGTAHDLRLQKQQQADLLVAYAEVENARNDLEYLNADLEQRVHEKTFDLQDAYRTLEEQNKALQQLDQLKSDFVSLVSHELRAPLTNIRGGIELLLATPNQQPERVSTTLQRVQSEILRLSKFTETILDLSALDANRLPLYPEPLDLKVATQSLQQYFSQAPSGERIIWQITEPAPIILADEKALHSVIFHLLDNALKYAPEGNITISDILEEDLVCIQVRDEGPGIAEETLPLLFQRFYRGNMADSQTVYGHGLGLYMVKRFVEAMNGTVNAENISPHGTVFMVNLPLHRE